MIRSSLIAIACVALNASIAGAQATRLVDPLDPVYQDLRELIDQGLVPRATLGQLPMSRAAIARMIDTAQTRLSGHISADSSSRSPVFSEPKRRFLSELLTSMRERLELPDSGAAVAGLVPQFDAIRSTTLDLTSTDEPTRLIPPDNGLGGIDATLNTLLINRQGLVLGSGANAVLETTHSLETDHVGFSVTPSLFTRPEPNGDRRLDLRVQDLQLRFLLRNVALDVGREYVVWGQGIDGGMLNSDNSPPLDLIKLSSESPFYLPSFLRHLGPTRASIFYADLGGDQNFPHAYQVAYRISVVPSSWAELGTSIYTKGGGNGGPPATFAARLVDFLPFLDASAFNNIAGIRGKFTFSDHYAGIDGRFRLPAGGASLYWDLLLNDFDIRRLKSVLWEDSGHIFGLDLPRLASNGRLDASLEYHHTGIRYYEHDQFTSGQTVHQTLTGDPLGPNAQGAYANLAWYRTPRRRLGIQVALERRSNDQYVYIPEPHFGFARVGVRPKEWQGRTLLTWQMLPARHQLGGQLQFGYERTRNFDFVEGDSRNGFLGRATLQYRFF